MRRALLLMVIVTFVSALSARAGPAQANPLTDIAAIAAGGGTCAVRVTGFLQCWGWSDRGYGVLPVDVLDASGQPLDDVRAVDLGANVCVRTSGTGALCWSGDEGATPTAVAGLTEEVADLAVGDGHACALTATGGVKCWGDNEVGQLGNGGYDESSEPVDVVGLSSGVTAIAAGYAHSCAVTVAGSVKCWGLNIVAQLGNESTEPCPHDDYDSCSLVPLDVPSLSGAVAVAAGGGHTCALTDAGAVKCWGANEYRQLGVETDDECLGYLPCSQTPVDVPGLASGVAAVAAGGSHTCALTTAGGVKCWGANQIGQIGAESSGPCFKGEPCARTPLDVIDLQSGVAAIALGRYHTCALTTAGGAKCWGNNGGGELGDGTRRSRPAPVDVLAVSKTATGDADCDGGVTSIDAVLILQLQAALISSLLCDVAADVNEDGRINALDAALILQYVAGLVDSLPP